MQDYKWNLVAERNNVDFMAIRLLTYTVNTYTWTDHGLVTKKTHSCPKVCKIFECTQIVLLIWHLLQKNICWGCVRLAHRVLLAHNMNYCELLLIRVLVFRAFLCLVSALTVYINTPTGTATEFTTAVLNCYLCQVIETMGFDCCNFNYIK